MKLFKERCLLCGKKGGRVIKEIDPDTFEGYNYHDKCLKGMLRYPSLFSDDDVDTALQIFGCIKDNKVRRVERLENAIIAYTWLKTK